MKFLDQVRRWVGAMEDIEDPRGAEVRRQHGQLRALRVRQSDRPADGESLP